MPPVMPPGRRLALPGLGHVEIIDSIFRPGVVITSQMLDPDSGFLDVEPPCMPVGLENLLDQLCCLWVIHLNNNPY